LVVQTAGIFTYRVVLKARDVIAGNAHEVKETDWDSVRRPVSDKGVSQQIPPDIGWRRIALGAARDSRESLTDFRWSDRNVVRTICTAAQHQNINRLPDLW